MNSMRIFLLFIALILATASCTSNNHDGSAGQSHIGAGAGQLHETWVLVEGTLLGRTISSEEEWGTRLTFQPNDKAIWRFATPEGEKAFDGAYHINASASPKQIDLQEPGSTSGTTALGIYRIKGDKLTILMGAQRPRSFSDAGLTRLILRRE